MQSNRAKLSRKEVIILSKNTGFSIEKVLAWHEQFIEKCPDGSLDKDDFLNFYGQLIPGDSSEERLYCELVFQVYDADNNGFINFGEFLAAFAIRSNASAKEKLEWLFDIYDYDDNNLITFWELYYVVHLLFRIKSINEDPYLKTLEIMQMIDKNKDGGLSKKEFVYAGTHNENLRRLFAPF